MGIDSFKPGRKSVLLILYLIEDSLTVQSTTQTQMEPVPGR